MPLSKVVGNYKINYTPFGIGIELLLNNGNIFSMGSIPYYVGVSLDNLRRGDLPKNEFYLIKKLVDRGLNPFAAVKSVNMSTEYVDTRCGVKMKSKELGPSKYGKLFDVVSCPTDDFEGSCISMVTLNNNSRVKLDDARAGLFIGALYNVGVKINGKELSDFYIQEIPCDGSPMAALNLKDTVDFTHLIAGLNDTQFMFLMDYDFRSKQFIPEKPFPREHIGSFIFKMDKLVRQGKTPRVEKIEINSLLPGTSSYVSDVTVAISKSTKKYKMIPSNSLLLAKLLGIDVFVDDQLENKIQNQTDRSKDFYVI